MKDNHKADISHTVEFDRMYQEMVKQAEDKYKVKSEHPKTEEKMPLDKAGQITDFEYDGLAYTLPDGYQFVDENGNVINATKIVLEKKKKEYPKTYEECEKVLRYDSHRLDNMGVTVRGYKWELIRAFQILLICRDAYWKIAGDEMGLGKPWEPDWTDDNAKYSIYTIKGTLTKAISCYDGAILTFPTEEMRDAFKENFDPDIEFCKEFL